MRADPKTEERAFWRVSKKSLKLKQEGLDQRRGGWGLERQIGVLKGEVEENRGV